jgi:hypothetical protein
MERQLEVRRAADSKPEFISCKACSWGVAVVATKSIGIDAEITRIFEKHDCTLYPKCEVEGCRRMATVGFRKLLDGKTSTTSGFTLETKTNCCEFHEAEIAKQYSSPDDIRVKLTALKGR